MLILRKTLEDLKKINLLIPESLDQTLINENHGTITGRKGRLFKRQALKARFLKSYGLTKETLSHTYTLIYFINTHHI